MSCVLKADRYCAVTSISDHEKWTQRTSTPLILATPCCPSYFNKLPGVTPNRCLNAR